jgi:CHAD domain
VKARRVKGLSPDMPLADAAARIIRVRLDELHSFAPRALDPAEVEALHDMRIAAKRLRYALEVTAPCFGPYARTAARRARELQDLVGEIHDCDVMLPQVLGVIDDLRARDAAELRRLAGQAEDLDPALAARAPNRAAYRGLQVLAAHLRARRELLFERFLGRWERLERRRFRAKLERALGERPRPLPTSPGADGGPPDGGAERQVLPLRSRSA